MPEWAATMIQTLEAQQALLDELEPLAERQGQLIREGRSDALLDLLSKRQDLIDRFLTTSERLGDQTDLADRLHELPEASRQRVRELVARIDGRLARVLELDERDQGALRDARDGSRRELASLDAGRTARNAYVQRSGGNRFADHRG